ncbi:hypothetical protein OAQ51_04755 [Gammaproteobacteria bacterium]|nr:hypothetical protein [Gammaproteobacteria bacterium]
MKEKLLAVNFESMITLKVRQYKSDKKLTSMISINTVKNAKKLRLIENALFWM